MWSKASIAQLTFACLNICAAILLATTAAMAADTNTSVFAPCLPAALYTDVAMRRDMKIAGASMPIGIWELNWDCARVMVFIYKIITEELLGYNTEVSGQGAASKTAWPALAGCVKGSCLDIEAEFHDVPPHHVALDVWLSPTMVLMKLEIEKYYPERAAEVFDSYKGSESAYVHGGAISNAWNSAGLSLEYFKSYNFSWHDPSLFFDSISDMDPNKTLNCAQWSNPSEMMDSRMMELYKVHFGGTDPSGVSQYADANGKILNKAGCHYDGSWWAAPACRSNPRKCVPYVTHLGWGASYLMQQSVKYNMPIAIANAEWDDYINLTKTHNILHYWWTPDSTFLQLGSTRLTFPAHDDGLIAKGLFITNSVDVGIVNAAHRDLKRVAPRPYKVLKAMQFSPSVIDSLLLDFMGGMAYREVACHFLKTTSAWLDWVPSPKDCDLGEGWHDASGVPVFEIISDARCQRCPAGRRSLILNDMHICDECAAGEFTNYFAAVECTSCEIGRFANNPGSSSCTRCPIGSFGTMSGMTACDACNEGESTFELTTNVKGVTQWTFKSGATNTSMCGCDIGMRLATVAGGRKCVACAEGMSCEGMSQVVILEGYAWDGDVSTYKCYGDSLRCPGGQLGSCAPGRDAKSVACAECEDGKTSSHDGSCTQCLYEHNLPFALVCIGIVVAHVVLYNVTDKEKKGMPSIVILVVGISFSQLVASVQLHAVVGTIHVDWQQPMKAAFDFLKLFNFDFDILNAFCIVSFHPVIRYLVRCSFVILCLTLIICIHSVFVVAKHGGNFKLRMPTLICACGTILLTFFVAIISASLLPLQCVRHPNSRRTLLNFPGLLCWEGGAHSSMVAIGAVSLIVPISFISAISWAVHVVPVWLNKGHTKWLHAFAFIFFRFKPECLWYAPAQMIRNVLLVIGPTLSSPLAQVVWLEFFVLCALMLHIHFVPWRVAAANLLDTCGQACMAMVLLFSTFFIEDDVDQVLACWLCFAFFCFGFIAAAATIARAGLKSMAKKKFQFLLCHHKAGAGAFTRLLKIHLCGNRGLQSRKVFLDSDDLSELGRLFDNVANDTETLVAIVSNEILTRPWCVGEITTAHLQNGNVKIMHVALPGVQPIPGDFVTNFAIYVPGVSMLYDHNIPLDKIQAALRAFISLPNIQIPKYITQRLMDSLANVLKSKVPMELDHTKDLCHKGATTWILADSAQYESMSTALVLRSYMLPFLSHAPGMIPQVLRAGEVMDDTVTYVIFICTTEVLQQGMVLKSLYVAAVNDASALPVLGDEGFKVPSREYLAEHKREFGRHVKDAEGMVNVLELVFRQIAIAFFPNTMSNTDLANKSREIANRSLPQSTLRVNFAGTISLSLTLSQLSDMKAKGDDPSIHWVASDGESSSEERFRESAEPAIRFVASRRSIVL